MTLRHKFVIVLNSGFSSQPVYHITPFMLDDEIEEYVKKIVISEYEISHIWKMAND